MTPGRALTEHVRLPPVIQALLQVTDCPWVMVLREQRGRYTAMIVGRLVAIPPMAFDDDAEGSWVLNATDSACTAPHRSA